MVEITLFSQIDKILKIDILNSTHVRVVIGVEKVEETIHPPCMYVADPSSKRIHPPCMYVADPSSMIHDDTTNNGDDVGSFVGVIIGSVIALLIVMFVGGVIFRYKTKKKPEHNMTSL